MHDHSHHHQHNAGSSLGLAFFLNLFFAIVELVGGLLTNSVAILSDALHDFGDCLALGLSWYFEKVAKRKRNESFSYGYARFSVLGAIITSVVLVVGSVFIISETIPRLLNPVQPETEGMILLSILGLAVNGFAAYRLSRGESLNERAVYLHLLEDVLGWSATLIGAVVMHFTQFAMLDALISIGIAVFILFQVYRNLRRALKIILQATPSNVDLNKIHYSVKSIPGVLGMHDCHIWSMDGRRHIFTAHIVVKRMTLTEMEALKAEVKHSLEHLGIHHATLELEPEGSNCEETKNR